MILNVTFFQNCAVFSLITQILAGLFYLVYPEFALHFYYK